MSELETLRPEVRRAFMRADHWKRGDRSWEIIRAELLRLTDENARLNKIESLATEQRLQMEDVELYLMDVSQPDDEDAPWCDRMKSAIELLVQDCNYAVGQKNKAEAELAALEAKIADAPAVVVQGAPGAVKASFNGYGCFEHAAENLQPKLHGKRVRLLVEE